MLLTIAIPAYNREDTLERAILSCINQETDQKYEIVIVDNASTDKTLEIAQSYANKKSNIKVISNEVNVNMWTNHNICMQNSNGDYVLFCHSDDILLSNALQVIYEKLLERKFPKKYVIWGHSMFNDFKYRLDIFNWRIGDYIVGEDAFKLFVDGGLTPSGTCYSRETFLQLGGFIEDSHIIFPNSDSSSMLRLAFNGFAFEMIDDIYFFREVSSSNYMKIKDKKQEKEDDFYMKNLLINNFSHIQLERISLESCNFRFIYAYYIAGINKQYKKIIFKRYIKAFIKKPTIIRNKYFRKIICS